MKFSLSLAACAALTMPSADAFTTKNPVDIGFVKTPCSRVILSLSDTTRPYSIFNYRFNKCPPIDPGDKVVASDGIDKFYSDGVHQEVFPLLQSDYTNGLEKKEQVMRLQTRAESVVLQGDKGLKEYGKKKKENGEKQGIAEYFSKDKLTGANIAPLFPGGFVLDGLDDTSEQRTFWNEFKEVVDAQKARRNNKVIQRKKTGKIYPWPNLWYRQPSISPWPDTEAPKEKTLTLDDVAQSVKGEFSNYHQQVYLNFLKDNAKLSTDMGNTFRCEMDFLGQPIRMAAVNAWSLDTVGPVNFYLKWHYGLPRPEEVAWLIHKGDFTEKDGVPREVISDIKGMKLNKATDFTAYENGSPMHPSFPAMHSAGSTCSLWVPALYDINANQYLQLLRTDYGVAFARTVAGVHYPQDNLAGLNIGQRVVRERLPKFLSENYDYDPGMVADKVNKLSFDWNEVVFSADGKNCTINGKAHDAFLQEAKDFKTEPTTSA